MLCKNDLKEEQEVKPQKGEYEDEIEDELEDAVQKVCDATGCSDIDLINQILKAENYNVESAIFAIIQVNEVKRISAEEQCDSQDKGPKSCSSALWEENGSGSRIFGKQSLHQDKMENAGEARCDEENRLSKTTKISRKQKKEQQRLEKKRRQEERHRQKVLANKSNWGGSNRRETDSDTQVTLVKATAALNI
ncbi:PREDICTED: OTU domain-containing protein 3, partial [Tinamus guttatus]|uniref:OTU domain-containing protein 3 n=1 Tax=Tinamus guttatus TaxID=94827 RepID=UPI00052EB8D4